MSLTVYDMLDRGRQGEKGSGVNRPLGVIRRLSLGAAVAGVAICVAVLAASVPARAAVELAYFYVTFRTEDVLIRWGTGSELTTVGFNLYRSDTVDFSGGHRLNELMIEASMDPAGNEYEYADDEVVPGATYYYWLEVVDSGGNEVFGPEPKPTPTATSTSTATSMPTATATPARTKTPTPTSTSMPTVTPSFTATAVSTSTPTATRTSTPVSTTRPAPSATSAPEQVSSPSATTVGMARPTPSSDDARAQLTPSPASTAIAVGSGTATATPVAWGGDSEPKSSGWSSFGLHWPTMRPSTILLLVSLASLLGALLLSAALALVHKLSL